MIKTDYQKIAGTYNKRYNVNYLVNIENELRYLISSNNYKNILEAGCGTGRWTSSLLDKSINVYGLDYSLEMLKISKVDKTSANIINADAVYIPFKDSFFDLVFCVNAIHHFPDKEKFISESKRTLTNNGTLAIFGVDPHVDKDWYIYDYFDYAYENDLERFPSLEQLQETLDQEKFIDFKIKVVEKVYRERIGEDIFNDPFLEKNHCSQLANLSDEEYQKGINKIKNQINQNSKTVFKTSVIFYLVNAKKK